MRLRRARADLRANHQRHRAGNSTAGRASAAGELGNGMHQWRRRCSCGATPTTEACA